MGYVHLSTTERHAIAVLHRLHYATRAIAAQLNRHHATIARELRRGMRNNTYIAADAHRAAIQRQHATPRIGRYTPHLATAISVLLCRTWSPEQIAGYQRTHGIAHVSFATIYRWMYAGKLPTVTVAALRHKGKRRAPQERRGRFAIGASIHMRPKDVATRQTFGHWEADTIVSGRGKSRACMATFAERHTRMYIAIPMRDRTAISLSNAVRTLVAMYPPGAIRTLTVDRGKEFAAHQELCGELHIPIYFADAYAAWQRGTNENSNGLLREFFAKGTDLATVTATQLQYALTAINTRPRKCLHWQSADVCFRNALSHLT